METAESQKQAGWLNRTVLGVGLTSIFADWSHETATAVLPAFLAVIGAGPAWLGVIEGVADGLSSFAKLAAGHYTDQLKRRKPLAVFGYAFTAIATASFGIATHAVHVLIGRSAAWLGRGVRSPAKKALLAADVPADAYGRAFGLERLMDTLGAILGPLTALWILQATGHWYRTVFLWTLLPGGYGLAVVTALLLCTAPHSLWLLGGIFVLAGLYIGTEEALEDSVAAEMMPRGQHGMAFGTMAAVNALGDFLSSLLVGALWSAFGVGAAFGASAVLFAAGAILILRLK